MAYLHGSDQRQQLIADELSRQTAAALGGAESRPIGHATGTTAGEGIVTVNGPPGHVGADLVLSSSAPGKIRTRDRLLRRYRWRVAGRRLVSLYKPSSSSYCGWMLRMSRGVCLHWLTYWLTKI
jgi:hypothetical protein